MKDWERLQELIDQDQEYQHLVAEVNAFGRTKFPIDGRTLDAIWTAIPKFKTMVAEEFFATFKCMVAWAVLMSRVLNKIHGISKYDAKKAFNIYSSAGNKRGLIYYEDSPRFYIETDNPDGPLCISVPLRVYGGRGGLVNGEITFKLVIPSVIQNSATSEEYAPKLLSSVMKVIVNYNSKTYDQTVQVRGFEPTWLSIVINNSGMGW